VSGDIEDLGPDGQPVWVTVTYDWPALLKAKCSQCYNTCAVYWRDSGWERIEGRGRRQCTHTPPLPTGAELERQLAKCTPGATRTFRL
jgi:hypothetical protein